MARQKDKEEKIAVEPEEVGTPEDKKTSHAILNLQDGTSIHAIHRLTPEDKKICAELYQRGSVDYLRFELNWTAADIKEFMAKKSVQAEMDYLSRAYAQREGIQERAQFFSQLKINTMVPAALGIVAKALRGDKISESGEIDRAPARGQFDAAVEVLDRANIHGGKYKGEDSPPVIDARSVSIALGETNAQNDPVDLSSRQSRDTVRDFMEKILGRLDDDGQGKRGRKRNPEKPRRES